MENIFDFSPAPSSPLNLDGTFLLESTEDETKQDENELLEMDANNNSPKVVSSNLPVPTIIVQPSTPSTPLPSTPKRKILPPVSTPISEQLARRRVEKKSVYAINKLPEKIENKLMKKVYDIRLVDENIGLKGELNSSRIKCEELQKQHSESHEKNIALKVELNSSRIECEELQKQLSESRQKNSVLEEANLSLQEEITKITEDGRKKVNELLKINEDLEQDKDTEISRLRNILEDGGARGDTTLGLQTSDLQPETLDEGGAGARSLENTGLGLQTQPEKLRKKSIGRPKKGRKSVNFTVPSKGAQSSKAMRRSQSSYAKINKTLLKEASAEPMSKVKMLENENNKLRLEIEELRKQLNKDEVKCPKANPAPNLKDVTVQPTKASILRAQVNLTRAASIKRPKAANK